MYDDVQGGSSYIDLDFLFVFNLHLQPPDV